MTRTNFADAVSNPEVKAQIEERRDKTAMPPEAVARAIAFAIEQPADYALYALACGLDL